LKLGHPFHTCVHWAGQDENYHSVVIVGHVGTNFYICNPLALDSSPRILSTGAEGEYIVDYIIPTHGNPPEVGTSSNNFLRIIDKHEFYPEKSSHSLNRFSQ